MIPSTMKKQTLGWILIAVAFILIAVSYRISESVEPAVITAPPADVLTAPQRVWMNALRWCESNGIDGSINPKDRDSTPSWGRYQFKPGTFTYYQGLYGLPKAELMDGEAQERIVEQMIVRGGITWKNEFPECTRKLGQPPKAKLSTPKRLTTDTNKVK